MRHYFFATKFQTISQVLWCKRHSIVTTFCFFRNKNSDYLTSLMVQTALRYDIFFFICHKHFHYLTTLNGSNYTPVRRIVFFCHSNSSYLTSHLVQTALRYGMFFLSPQKIQLFDMSFGSKRTPVRYIFFSSATKIPTIWQVLWFNPHSGNIICEIFISV